MAKPSWWPYCWDAWRKSRWTVGFSSFFFCGGGGWFNRKGFPVFFVKRKNNIKFLLPKIQYRFHLGHFLKPQKEWTKKGLYSFDWRFGIGSKVSFVCWWTSGSFQNDTQVDVFKMIQDDSRCIFSILLCSCDPSGGCHFWILRGCAIIATSSQSRSWRGLYTTQHFQVVHKSVTRWSMKKKRLDDLCRGS